MPRRALFHPTLRYAVFAFSSQHLNRNNQEPGDTGTEALEYYNKCLNLLIPAISAPDRHVSEEVHAAVAILRQYEEMDRKHPSTLSVRSERKLTQWTGEDLQFHLTGTRRIMNSMRDFDFTPGLRESSAWLCLRQDIYISLVNHTPLQTQLTAFLQSDCFRRTDDFAYATKMVYWLAQVAACAVVDPLSSTPPRLEEIAKQIDDWFRMKPPTFNPIKHKPRDQSAGRVFPEIWMLLPCHGKAPPKLCTACLCCGSQPMLTFFSQSWAYNTIISPASY